MKDKDELKDKAIEYGIEIAKSLALGYIKSRFTKKSNISSAQTINPMIINDDKSVVKVNGKVIDLKKKKKKKSGLIKKAIVIYAFKELIYDRLKAKLSHSPNLKDYSWLYDYPAGKDKIDMQEMVNQIQKEDNVIDLGCGLGYFGINAAKKTSSGKSYLLDQDMKVLEKAQELAQEAGVENIEIHRAYIEKLPFEDYIFDKAFLNINLGQVSDKAKALTEIRRVLKEKGKLYITDIISNDYYCLSSNIINIATSTGLKLVSEKGNFLGYTLVFEK